MEFKLTYGLVGIRPPKASVIMPMAILDPIVDMPEEKGQEIETKPIPPCTDAVQTLALKCANCGRTGGLARMDGALINLEEGIGKLIKQGWGIVQDQPRCPDCSRREKDPCAPGGIGYDGVPGPGPGE